MPYAFRRALSLLTAATLVLGATAINMSPAHAAEDNVIPDPELRACIATAIDNAIPETTPESPDSITENDLQVLLNAWYEENNSGNANNNGDDWSAGIYCSGVASLEGLDVIGTLEHAEAFLSFMSDFGTIADVTPLANLTSLQRLGLSNNQITDISGLAGLTDLWMLGLANNQITDISALAGLSNLTELYLNNNAIIDVSGLAGLSNLKGLYLSDNAIIDVSGLAKLSELPWLSLDNNEITDISPLAGLTSVGSLTLRGNKIANISPLAGLTNLFLLDLSDNLISDVSPLAGLPALYDLKLSGNQIADIKALAGKTGLEFLDLSDNHITTISPLSGLTSLWRLYLSGNQIVDVSPLAGLTDLYELDLADNKVADISSLASLLNATGVSPAGDDELRLSQVNFNGNQITDLSTLARKADGQVEAGDTPDLANTYAGKWGSFIGQTPPAQAVLAGATVPLPEVKTAPDSKYPLVWEVVSGDAVINPNGTVTYNSVGPVQLAWSNPMPAKSGPPESETTVTASTFTGIVSINAAQSLSQAVAPSAPTSKANKDTVAATTTGGIARLADDADSYTITAVLASAGGVPLTGFAASLTATVPGDVTVGAWTDNGDGTYTAPVTAATPGNYAVDVALDGTIIASIPVNFIAATVAQAVRLPSETQHAEGLGFLPGEEVEVTVHSEPLRLGRLTASGTGSLAVSFTVPAGFAPGLHTVSFVGATSGTVVVPFHVVSPFSVQADTGGMVANDQSALMGIAVAITCLAAAGFALVMARSRKR